jgi:hypothetical protein
MPARTLWWGPPPRRKSQAVAQRWPPTGRACREGPLRKGSPEISHSFLMMSLPSRVVISLTFLTDSAEMRALPILPARAHALQQSNTDEHQCGSSARSLSRLKLARCPHSLVATLATLPSMSLIPSGSILSRLQAGHTANIFQK